MHISEPVRCSSPSSGADAAKRGVSRLGLLILKVLHPAAEGCGACRLRLPDIPERRGETGAEPAPDFPVDVVYTWVDGSDPAHAAKRARYLSDQKDIHPDGLELARYRENEELRYSLRSLETFAPWVRRVIILTDNQVPAWLDVSHPKIRIADHKECIPERFLPTFNAQVIEAYLHRIPDLSEHFIYFNDDVMLGRPCRQTDFFTPNGLPITLVDWRWRRRFGYWYTKTPHACSYYNTLALLKQKGVSSNPLFVSAHGPYAQTRGNVAAAYEFFHDFIENFSGNRFRGTNEIGMYSHATPLLMYPRKRVIPSDQRYFYVQTKRWDRAAYYRGIVRSQNDAAPPFFFCINDVGSDTGTAWHNDLLSLMEAYFPVPCSFERTLPGESGYWSSK